MYRVRAKFVWAEGDVTWCDVREWVGKGKGRVRGRGGQGRVADWEQLEAAADEAAVEKVVGAEE